MRPFPCIIAVLVVALAVTTGPGDAQTREQGPWWPSEWGPEDQAGASNRITPAKVLEAVKLVKTGKIYELGQIYEHGMPLFGQRTYSLIIPSSPTGGPFGSNQLVYHDEFLTAEIGQVGTQFDGPAHVGKRMKMADGTIQDVFYNGFTRDEMRGAYGVQQLGVENIKPFITRGVLIDVAGYLGVEHLEHAYEVTVDDVLGSLKKQGMSEDSIREGDALLFRYGWSKLWDKPEEYNDSPPGIGLAVADWIIERKAAMVGTDQWTNEVVPNPDPDLAFPVHQRLMPENGIWLLENMVLEELAADQAHEFLFVHTPIRFKGGTGSPCRPLAIR